jgi:YVTN family beta-propeller protein
VHRKLYAANSDDNFVSVIDGVSNQIIKRIDGLGDGLEQPRYNAADGMVYLPSTRENLLHQFDPVVDELVQTFDIGDACNPNGLAVNANTNMGLLGCSSRQGYQHAALWDFATQRVVATFDQIGGGNATLYDPIADRFFFTATSEGQPLTGIFRGAPVQFLGNVVAGGGGGSSVAFDETNWVVYVHDRRPDLPGLVSFPLPALGPPGS